MSSQSFLSCCLALLLAVAGASAQAKAPAPTRSPEAVSQALYQAWHANSRKGALKLATPEAVDKLFGVRWRKMKFEGCTVREEGGFECVWRDRALDLSMAMLVDGGASLGGYNVSSLSFSSEG